MLSIVDTSPLYAAADANDRHHDACVSALRRPDLQLVVPVFVVAEAAYLVAERLGPRAEAAFLRGMAKMEVESPSVDDWERMAALVEQYRDFPLGAADASVVALAERLGTDCVITLDRRHFGAVRPRHVPAFHLLPE